MPVFHTKTIESILEPVAQQVSRLVILHEDAEDGSAMPDLEKPVQAVSRAVMNLIKVGKETINSSDDPILKQDLPSALYRVEGASRLLEEASAMLKQDPYSGPARRKLIEGSRGILQGTSSLLLCFDESEVRKIIRECKKVLDYLAVAEVIESMEDLVQFLKDLSPCLSKVSREVGAREKELTHQVHRDILIRCLDQVKTLAPILICSMKIYIHILSEGGKGAAEAAENRDYLTSRMTGELLEIIRVLQLTTYDEDEWEADNITVMRKALNVIEGKVHTAHDWLQEPLSMPGGLGEKSIRHLLEQSHLISERCSPKVREPIQKLCSEINTMTDALCELRHDGKGATAQAESLSRSIDERIGELVKLVTRAVNDTEKSGVAAKGQQVAHTLGGQLDQARQWLLHPERNDNGLGQRAILLITDEAHRVADGLPGVQRAEILNLCDEVGILSQQLSDLCRRGEGNSPQAQQIARKLSHKLDELKKMIQDAVVSRVVEDFVDINTPLKQFTDAVHVPKGTPGREANFADRATRLSDWSKRAGRTGRLVAATGSGGKKLSEALNQAATQLESLGPQLINGGQIRSQYSDNKVAGEHFDNLCSQYADTATHIRNLCDEATDSATFIRLSEDQMRKHAKLCEDAIARHDPNKMVEHTTAIARLGNRVYQVAKQEADNSEDPVFHATLNRAADILQAAVARMVQDAKPVALNTNNNQAVKRWRESNNVLLDAVRGVRGAITVVPDLYELSIEPEIAPPRPPLPGEQAPPPRPPLPAETDDEDEMFKHAPLPNQPIMAAAHGLHQEVRQWSSKDNKIIAAAKKMALLMGRLSQLVRGQTGTKRDLIACAKAIAEASEEVTRLAKELARECTDKRMRTNLLQVCERIPTIGTQLKILSTVKATMLGAHGSEEDQEATDMLVGNAQNLMQSVKETVRAAEAASIKIRTDTGIRLCWVRRQPWYHY
ncbi:hypothetical protein QTP88_027768 [Uroleucon formosanum]